MIKWLNDVTGMLEASQTIDRMVYVGIEIDHKIVAKSELEQNTRLENSHCWLVTTVTSVTITINYTWQNPAACHYSSFTPVGVRYEQTGTLQDHNNDNYNWSALTVRRNLYYFRYFGANQRGAMCTVSCGMWLNTEIHWRFCGEIQVCHWVVVLYHHGVIDMGPDRPNNLDQQLIFWQTLSAWFPWSTDYME